MTRLPIRIRVTLAFAGALLVVLAAVGAFLYLRLARELTQTLDRSLQTRAVELAGQVRRAPEDVVPAESSALEADESVAQILRANGRVLAGTSQARAELLDASQLRRARDEALLADRPGDDRLEEAVRLLAVPVRTGGERFVVVVGASLDEKREALSSLLALEVVGLGVALLVASGAGYLVAGLALRPVEAMRRGAEAISDEPDRRLPVPPVHDEIGRLGRTLNAMLERLERAGAAEREAIAKERRFVADASHELRTPLTVLKSELDVALLGRRSASRLATALESAGEETDRLIRLAEDLLVLAGADEGRLPLRPEPVDVADLLEEMADRQRAGNGLDGRRVVAHAPPGLWVEADRLRLEQALANLLDNAARHGAGDVELTAEDGPDGVVLAVRDQGTGFPDGFADRAFERFSRADSGRTGGGTGLGLAIVEAIARAHGGLARVAGAGPGARIEILLPHSSNAHPRA